MATEDRYARPIGDIDWPVAGTFDTNFRWEYQDGRESLLRLYEKGKEKQWNANARIDWSQDLDPENPEQLPDESIPLFGSDVFAALTNAEKATLRRHFQSWQLSQFLHGEQGALICTAKIVQQVPRMDAKFYAATQVIDEARHVEAYSRLLHDKFELAYPITPTLQRLLDNVLSDSRWDMTYLGMQVLIEGLALAAFAQIRDQSQNPLAAAVNAYVMQDEARHVAFGRFALRDYYPTLTQAERDEREEFAVEACYLMRDRFQAEEVWETLGLPIDECAAYMLESGFMQRYRSALFSRIVPIIKDIGLWGPKIRKGYEQMGILGYADIDVQAMAEEDEKVAEQYDARHAEIVKVARSADEGGEAAHGNGGSRRVSG
ncbi:MAG: ferritin-like domain-containing protein [Deltaproteobacteria bacterium]|nr:ferritin-like domain-containing protein [Deltaproteobacteria bacterium]